MVRGCGRQGSRHVRLLRPRVRRAGTAHSFLCRGRDNRNGRAHAWVPAHSQVSSNFHRLRERYRWLFASQVARGHASSRQDFTYRVCFAFQGDEQVYLCPHRRWRSAEAIVRRAVPDHTSLRWQRGVIFWGCMVFLQTLYVLLRHRWTLETCRASSC